MSTPIIKTKDAQGQETVFADVSEITDADAKAAIEKVLASPKLTVNGAIVKKPSS